VRIASVIVVPAAVFLAVLGAPLCEALFAYGAFSPRSAQYTARCSACSRWLVPFMLTSYSSGCSTHSENRPCHHRMVMLIVA